MPSASPFWEIKPLPDLSEGDLEFFSESLQTRTGICLRANRFELVRTRLRSRIDAHGLETYSQYREMLRRLPPHHSEWEQFTNQLTTNKTDFFREPQHFEHLARIVLPQWLKTNRKTFQVWSAASSTGEEAYTAAMILDRFLPQDRDFRILATDVDTSVLATAKNAVYPDSRVDEIPDDFRAGTLQMGRAGAQGWFRIAPRIRERVSFKTHNLIDRSVPEEAPFDLVICRNVFIYFAPQTIEFVQQKINEATRLGGYLYIGHSESFQGLKHRWQSAGSSVFRR